MALNRQNRKAQKQVVSSIQDLIDYCRKNNRVCPMPNKWSELYELLPDKKRVGGGWEPALPLILAAWYETPALAKMLRLAEHIKWAANHGVLDEVESFLRGLQEDDWYHLSE